MHIALPGWDWAMFFWGCVGGLAPDVVLLYKFRHRKYEVYNWVQYGVALLAIILLAGLVTAGVVRPPRPFLRALHWHYRSHYDLHVPW